MFPIFELQVKSVIRAAPGPAPAGPSYNMASRFVLGVTVLPEANLERSMSDTQAPRRDYRSTLNLPQTAFPMRAELPKREPGRIAWWAERGTYAKRLAKNAGNPTFTLHDGPPYANGDLHMGHFLNRVLKDAFVKINLLDGKYADFVPGWDMHGLPIELETLKHLKLDFHRVDPLELREKCRERALYWLEPSARCDLAHGRARANTTTRT